MAKIGFIGLGNMGAPMAVNLIKAGHQVTGFDLSVAACKTAADLGVAIAPDAASAARNTEVVITMLPAGQHVLAVYADPAGMMAVVDKHTLIIDCSTIDVGSARAAHEIARHKGLYSLDAPVSGGVGGATAGTLTFMVGGEQDAFARGEPILACMGKKIVHCGDAGAGQSAKICNNMILGVSMIAVSEAFVLAEKLGLSHQAMFDVVSTASGQCWSLTSYCPVPGPVPTSPANKDYKAGFAAALMLKDLALSQQAAEAFGVDAVLGRHAARLYEAFNKAGHADLDFSAIVNDVRARSGAVHD